MLTELIDGLQVTLSGPSESDHGEREQAAQRRRRRTAPTAAGGPQDGSDAAGAGGPSCPTPAELRELLERARRGELLRLTLGEDRWQLVERMQAVMSLIEGHAEHTMDAIGAEVLPSLPRLRAAMNRRRETRGLPWRVLERLLGPGAEAAPVRGRAAFLRRRRRRWRPGGARARMERPEALPSTAELAAPEQWLARTGATS